MDAIHIVGAGGIGCAVGHALRQAGAAVVLVDADPEKVSWGRRHGVVIDGRPRQAALFECFSDWQPPLRATILLCTKCYDNAAVLARLPTSACLVPIQNGFDPALQVRAHELEGIASFVSECIPGRTHTRITRRGRLHLGPAGVGTPGSMQRARELAGLLHGGPFRVELVPEIQPYKYTKLMYNAAISPLAAAAGIDNGELLRHAPARRLFFALLQENHTILSRVGIPLGKVGPFHPSTVTAILRRPWVARSLAWAFYPSLRGTYCSMSGDLPRGRTEIEYYNRHLIDLAGSTPCPLNQSIYALVKHMESERLRPHPKVLSRLAS